MSFNMKHQAPVVAMKAFLKRELGAAIEAGKGSVGHYLAERDRAGLKINNLDQAQTDALNATHRLEIYGQKLILRIIDSMRVSGILQKRAQGELLLTFHPNNWAACRDPLSDLTGKLYDIGCGRHTAGTIDPQPRTELLM